MSDDAFQPQRRYWLTAAKPDAERAFAALESALDDDGFPVALRELDEARQIFEVAVYAEGAPDAIRRRLSDALPEDLRGLGIEDEDIPDVDWVTASLEGLKPVRAGRFLVHGSHDRAARRAGDIAIEIEAGLAFGTGHHGTTAGCLEMIAAILKCETPRRALDLGSGSGVLAIALARAAHIPVLATDIDPVATHVAVANARLNRAGALVATATAAGFHHPSMRAGSPYDLIVANILARPLMRLAPEMARHIAPAGSLLLSGILERQRDAVVAAYCGQRFRHLRTLHREGWVTIWMKR